MKDLTMKKCREMLELLSCHSIEWDSRQFDPVDFCGLLDTIRSAYLTIYSNMLHEMSPEDIREDIRRTDCPQALLQIMRDAVAWSRALCDDYQATDVADHMRGKLTETALERLTDVYDQAKAEDDRVDRILNAVEAELEMKRLAVTG